MAKMQIDERFKRQFREVVAKRLADIGRILNNEPEQDKIMADMFIVLINEWDSGYAALEELSAVARKLEAEKEN